jgi:hypothetical protein
MTQTLALASQVRSSPSPRNNCRQPLSRTVGRLIERRSSTYLAESIGGIPPRVPLQPDGDMRETFSAQSVLRSSSPVAFRVSGTRAKALQKTYQEDFQRSKVIFICLVGRRAGLASIHPAAYYCLLLKASTRSFIANRRCQEDPCKPRSCMKRAIAHSLR